jgi:hypothetical protein
MYLYILFDNLLPIINMLVFYSIGEIHRSPTNKRLMEKLQEKMIKTPKLIL